MCCFVDCTFFSKNISNFFCQIFLACDLKFIFAKQAKIQKISKNVLPRQNVFAAGKKNRGWGWLTTISYCHQVDKIKFILLNWLNMFLLKIRIVIRVFFPQMAIPDTTFLRLTHFFQRRCVRLTHKIFTRPRFFWLQSLVKFRTKNRELLPRFARSCNLFWLQSPVEFKAKVWKLLPRFARPCDLFWL